MRTITTIVTIIISTLSPTNTQSIQILNLSNNPGLLTIKDGYSFLKTGNHKLFHIIDLEKYETVFRKLTLNIKGIKQFGNFTQLVELIEMKYSNTLTLYSDIQPKFRNKRGLLDFIGTGIKFITGNPDSTDLQEISQSLDNLRKNNKLLIKENNKQAKINFQLQNKINALVFQLEKQQTQITKNIINSRSETDINRSHTILKEIFKINFNLDMLYHHFENLFDAIQMAKLKIISKDILGHDEIEFAIQILKKHNVIPNSVEQVYQFLELSAYYNNTELIFVVYIPLLDDTKFNTIILEPIPVGNRTLILPASTAMQSGNRTYFITSDCTRVENYAICEQQNLLDVSKDSCYSKLLLGSSGNCSFTERLNLNEVKLLNSNHIIIKSDSKSEVRSDCGIIERNLKGTYLIEFHNCSVFVNGSRFQNTETWKAEKSIILPLDGLQIFENHFEPTTNIHQLNIANRQQIENIAKENKLRTYTSISMSTCSIILIIILCLLWIVKRPVSIKIQNNKPISGTIAKSILNEQPTAEDSTIEKTTKTSATIESRRFELRGGAVNTQHSNQPIETLSAGNRSIELPTFAFHKPDIRPATTTVLTT